MKIRVAIILLLLNSCSSFEKKYNDYSHLSEPIEKDYIEHLASLGDDFLATPENAEKKLNQESIQYLEEIYDRIISNNELLLSKQYKPQFHIILNKMPFIFSLPKSQFYISRGLVEKYLKSEELFVAAMSFEILKSNRNIYEKKILIPLGFYSTEKIIQVTTIKAETKYQVNEWNYFILKRAGYDPTAILNWIQIQNRNTLDFSLYLGDAIAISKEEHFFKNFITKQGVVGVEKTINEANSSKAFYKLLNNITSKK